MSRIAEVSSPSLKSLTPVLNQDNAILDDAATSSAIVKVREELDVSQKALSIEMGITQSYLCDLEMGRRHWRLKLFNKAKAALERLSK